MLKQTTVIIKAAKDRHVFVGTSKLSPDAWSEHPITGDIIKGIRTGDIIEGKVDDLEPQEEKKPAKPAEK